MSQEDVLILQRVVKVMEFATKECPNIGISCDIWEHDVDCTCLLDEMVQLVEHNAK